MKNYEEKEKKLDKVLKKLNTMSNKVVKMNNDIDSLETLESQPATDPGRHHGPPKGGATGRVQSSGLGSHQGVTEPDQRTRRPGRERAGR